MTPHDGPTCQVCGCPIRSPDELQDRLCDVCYEWNVGAADAVGAIDYSERERARAEQERWKQRKKAR